MAFKLPVHWQGLRVFCQTEAGIISGVLKSVTPDCVVIAASITVDDTTASRNVAINPRYIVQMICANENERSN